MGLIFRLLFSSERTFKDFDNHTLFRQRQYAQEVGHAYTARRLKIIKHFLTISAQMQSHESRIMRVWTAIH